MQPVYSAYCHQCGDLSIIPAEKETHINIARNHNNQTGHTCEVYRETKSVFVDRRNIKVASGNDKHVIETFGG